MRSTSKLRLLAVSVATSLVSGLAVTSGFAGAVPATAARAEARDYVDLVNPWVEADRGRYFFFQSASNPFGFVKLRPDTSTHDTWGTGYRHNENDVKGFSHVHEWQLSGVQVMPTTGAGVPKTEGDTGWQSHVEHDDTEVAEPGYHKLHLDRYGVTAELTTTDRVGLHRYTYDEAGPSDVIVNLGGRLGEAIMRDAKVTKVGSTEINGYVNQHGHGYPTQNTRLFFSISFDRPFDSLHGWTNGRLVDGGATVDEVSGDDMGVFARFDHLAAGEVVQMKVGLSLTGVEGARKNVRAELPGWDFDAVKEASQERWNEMLGRIDVKGGTDQQQEKFYTDLFHVLCGRSMVSDADGTYLDNAWGSNQVKQIPVDRRGRPKFAMYNYDALWLTQWNVNSVLGLAYPEVLNSFVNSQLQMYKDGGLLPRGPVGGNYSMVMTGSPVTSFITGAWNKGVRDFDANLAVEAMQDAHSLGGLFELAAFEYGGWGGCGGAKHYFEKGYVPEELCGGPLNGGAGQTLEYAHQDWALGQLADQVDARGLNIAQVADVEVSSQANTSTSAGIRAVDGRPTKSRLIANQVEWSSDKESNPWVKLSWDQPRRLRQVRISDRAGADTNVNAGTLSFSDGSSVEVKDIAKDGC